MKELVKILLLVNILILFTLVIGGCSDKMSENNDDSISNYNKSPNKVLLKKTINRNCKYVLNYWWYEPKDMAFQKTSYIPAAQSLTPKQQEEAANSLESFKNFDNVQYLQIANWQKNEGSEQAILPSCYACRILSSAIHYDIYDSETIGITYLKSSHCLAVIRAYAYV